MFIPMSNAMFSSLPEESVRLGSGLSALKRNLGRSVGSAAISVVFADRLAIRLAMLTESTTAASPAFRFNLERLSAALRDLGIRHQDAGALQVLRTRLWEEASAAAFGDCYFILSISILLALIPACFIRHVKS